MKNSDSDHLHRLVHAMTRAEKRYFKLYASRHHPSGAGVQRALFDAIAAMPVYDMEALRRQFAGKPFLRRFAITKRRLYETILESLDAFYANSSVDDQLRRMLHHVEILHHKALHADAAKVLRAAQALARAHNKQALHLQAAEWERRLWERANYSGITSATLADHAREAGEHVNQWLEVDRLWQLKSETFLVLYRCGQAPGPREQEELATLATHPLLAEGAVLHTPHARFLHHHVRSALAYAQSDLPTCETHLEACAVLLRAEARLLTLEPGFMLGVLGNLAQVRLRLGRHREALEGFREFRLIPMQMAKAPDPDLEVKLFVLDGSLQLAVRSVQGEFANAMEILNRLEEGLARFSDRISTVRRTELMLQMAYVALGAGMPGRALHWCNQLLNEKGVSAHVELHALGRMLNLMCLVELGKADHVHYVVRNTRRTLKLHGTPLALELVLLDHANDLLADNRKAANAQPWKRLWAALVEATMNSRQAAALDQIDLVAWARAKAEGRTLQDLLREKWLAMVHDRANDKANRKYKAA